MDPSDMRWKWGTDEEGQIYSLSWEKRKNKHLLNACSLYARYFYMLVHGIPRMCLWRKNFNPHLQLGEAVIRALLMMLKVTGGRQLALTALWFPSQGLSSSRTSKVLGPRSGGVGLSPWILKQGPQARVMEECGHFPEFSHEFQVCRWFYTWNLRSESRMMGWKEGAG
jgi:hypothetical protein